MSIFSKIGKVLGGVGKTILGSAASAIPVVGPLIGGTLAASGAASITKALSSKKSKSKALTVMPGGGVGGGSILPPLSGLGGAAAGAAGGLMAGMYIDQDGNVRKRRRRKGITAKDLMSFKRVARLVDKFSKPVHHFRNFKKGS